MQTRIDWTEIPQHARIAIEERTGLITAVRTVSGGLNSALAAVLDTATGPVFVKGIPTEHRNVVTQHREALINSAVQPVAPALLWHLPDTAGWSLLGFQYVEARHADYTPGSPDVAAAVATLDALAGLPCPDLPIKNASRWRSYADDGDTTPFEGNNLLHTDWRPDNVLIEADSTVRLVDWAWPTRGAAWIDAACLVIQLIACGHSPTEAEACVAHIRAWHDASPTAVDGFCRANTRLWGEIEDHNPTPWHRSVAEAARAWAQNRDANAV